MTTPKVRTIKQGNSRFYVHPDTRAKVPGVTSVVGMLPKEFLKFWAAKLVAETAVDNVGPVIQMLLNGEREGAIDFLKKAPMRNTGKAADVGTDAHDIFEKMAKGQKLGRIHPELVPFRDHFQEFLDLFKPEFLFMEETVWSDTHGYAGSFDAMLTIRAEVLASILQEDVEEDSTVVVDYKTTRSGVHAEVALQLAAYRYADHIISDSGSVQPLPELDGGAVLHVRPEGWKLVPIRCDQTIHQFFLSLIPTIKWEKEESKTVIGKPLFKSAEAE